MKSIFTTILICIAASGFGQIIHIPLSELQLQPVSSQTIIYIKKLDYFNYRSNDFVIDSVKAKNGNIAFEKPEGPGLFLISFNKERPITYEPLIRMPHQYYFMFCSGYYKLMDFVFLDENYNTEEGEFFNWFYQKFTSKSFDNKFYGKSGEAKSYPIKVAENHIEKRKQWFKKHLDRKRSSFSQAFIQYIETEIELGATNQFLNWYEEVFGEMVGKTICPVDENSIHNQYYKTFLSGEWDKNAIQYFKTSQRLVNHKLSEEHCAFRMYHVIEKENKNQ